MPHSFRYLFLLLTACLLSSLSFSQKDTTSISIIFDSANLKKSNILNSKLLSAEPNQSSTKKITATQKHIPRVATIRSLILPGWGQAYNKEYWKIPVVWGALSIPTATFFYNNTIYKEASFAHEARNKAALPNATKADSADYFTLETKYQKADRSAIQNLRNEARRDRDYSVFWFLIIWGLNVADATVFAHLKDFDVSPNLAVNIKPNFNPYTYTPSLSFNFKIKKSQKPLFVSTR